MELYITTKAAARRIRPRARMGAASGDADSLARKVTGAAVNVKRR
jgi:hypothetical protein